MQILVLVLACYLAVAAETTVLRDWLTEVTTPMTVWALLPLLATSSKNGLPILVAGLVGLTIDAVSPSPLGLNVCVAAIATFGMQRSLPTDSLNSGMRQLMAAMASAALMTMLMFVIQSTVFGAQVDPTHFLRQFGVGIAIAGCWGVLIGTLVRVSNHAVFNPSRQND